MTLSPNRKKKSKVLITLIKRLLENRLFHTLVITSLGKEMFLHLSFLIYPTDRRLVHHAPGFYFVLELFMPIKWIKLSAENSWTLCSSFYKMESGNWFTDMKDIKVNTARCKTMLPFGWKETAKNRKHIYCCLLCIRKTQPWEGTGRQETRKEGNFQPSLYHILAYIFNNI